LEEKEGLLKRMNEQLCEQIKQNQAHKNKIMEFENYIASTPPASPMDQSQLSPISVEEHQIDNAELPTTDLDTACPLNDQVLTELELGDTSPVTRLKQSLKTTQNKQFQQDIKEIHLNKLYQLTRQEVITELRQQQEEEWRRRTNWGGSVSNIYNPPYSGNARTAAFSSKIDFSKISLRKRNIPPDFVELARREHLQAVQTFKER